LAFGADIVKVIAQYSHGQAQTLIQENFSNELQEIIIAIDSINIEDHRTKITKETGQRFSEGQRLFSPISLNQTIYQQLEQQGWQPERIAVPSVMARGSETHLGFRELDGLKNKVGLEIQFGKYAFMGYDILGKMPLFRNKGLIEVGIEVVMCKEIAVGHMSSGVSYFEQIVGDLELRGVADLDVPVLVLGIGFKNPPS
jgi:hypothetical protein